MTQPCLCCAAVLCLKAPQKCSWLFQLVLSFQLSHGKGFKPCSIFRTNLVLWMDRRSFYISGLFFLSMNFHGEQFNSHLTSKFAPFKCSDEASLSIWMRQKLLIWCFHVFTVSLCHQIGEAVGGNLKILLCCPFHFKLNVFSCSSFNWRVHAASPGAPLLELVRSSPFSDRLAELHSRVYCLVLQSLSPPNQMHQSGLVTLYTNAHLIWKHLLCTRQIAGDTSACADLFFFFFFF